MSAGRVAVVLFNLGAPDSLDAVEPFLRNLFNDPAIIGLPRPMRGFLAWLIARRRRETAQAIYAEMGGSSPLLANTEVQARALETELAGRAPETDWKCFVAMRHWRPQAPQVAADVKRFGPETIVMLPLYPQFSTTTTGSSFGDWRKAAAKAGLNGTSLPVCCYPDEDGFLADIAAATAGTLAEAGGSDGARVLFSAHGLPEKIVEKGDPYQWQVEQTVAGIADRMAVPGLDWQVCYQSRVGPLTWIGPATEDEIRRAGNDRKAIVMVPVAFVSEHSETLVELDIEYKKLADESGVPAYHRVPAVAVGSGFIGGLAETVMTRLAAGGDGRICDYHGGRVCPSSFGRCPSHVAAGR